MGSEMCIRDRGWRAEAQARVADILTTRHARFNVKVWLFHPTTRKPLVKRHQLHQPSSKRPRFEMAVEKYKQSILADGVLEGAAVLVLVQDSEDAQNEKGLVEMAVVDGGTLFDAMYAAIKENPINPHCIKLLRDGVTNTLVLDHTTEDEEILFLKAVFRQQFTVPQLSSWFIPWLRGRRVRSRAVGCSAALLPVVMCLRQISRCRTVGCGSSATSRLRHACLQ